MFIALYCCRTLFPFHTIFQLQAAKLQTSTNTPTYWQVSVTVQPVQLVHVPPPPTLRLPFLLEEW